MYSSFRPYSFRSDRPSFAWCVTAVDDLPVAGRTLDALGYPFVHLANAIAKRTRINLEIFRGCQLVPLSLTYDTHVVRSRAQTN